MSLERVVETLERQRVRLNDRSDHSHIDHLTSLINMLDTPLFQSLWQLQSSIQELNRMSPTHQANVNISPDGTLVPHVDSYNVADKTDTLNAEAEPHRYHDSVVSSVSDLPIDELDFQQSIERMAQGRPTKVITLTKTPDTSLGFSVLKAKDDSGNMLGIFIQQIQPGSIADSDGQLQKDDQILAINGQTLVDVSHEQAICILQSAEQQVQLVVARSHDGEKTTPETAETPKHKPSESDMLNTEWTQIEIIELINDGTGLGFGIIGGRSTGVVVKTILPGGVADINGRLRSGDHILYINDVNVRGMSSEQVASVLRQSGSHVRLIIARSILEPPIIQDPNAPIIPTNRLDEQLENLFISDSQDQLDCVGLSGSEDNSPMGLPPSYYSSYASDVEVYNRPNDVSKKVSETETFEVTLVKDQQGLGITIAGVVGGDSNRDELSGIFVKGITDNSPAAVDGRIRVNDQICEVDSCSLWTCTNQEAVEILRLTENVVKLRLLRYLSGPKYQQLQQQHPGQPTIVPKDEPIMNHIPPAPVNINDATNTHVTAPSTDCFTSLNHNSHTRDEVDEDDNESDEYFFHNASEDYSGELNSEVEETIKACWEPIIGDDFDVVVAQLSKFQESAGLGISLEGTVDIENGIEVRPHHYIRAILQHGPVGMNGKLKSGDELLEVNGKRILGLNHVNVVTILKKLPKNVRIVCARRKRSASEIYADEHSDQFSPSTFSMGVQPITPFYDRMVKSKSDMTLSVANDTEAINAVNKAKSRSLEPLTGLAVWSPEPVVIELIKGDRGLGFSILDYTDPLNQSEVVIVIRSLVPGGVAQLDGRLIPGDRLVFVNDVDLENEMLDQAVQALKGAPPGIVRIGVAKPLPVSQSFHPQVKERSLNNEFDTVNNNSKMFTVQSEITVPQTNINLMYTPIKPLHSLSVSSSNSDSDIEELKSRLKRERLGSFSSSSSEDGADIRNSSKIEAKNVEGELNQTLNTYPLVGHEPDVSCLPPIVPPPPLYSEIDWLSQSEVVQSDSFDKVPSVPTRRLSSDAAEISTKQLTPTPLHSHDQSYRTHVTSQPGDTPPVKPPLAPKPYSLLKTIQVQNKSDSKIVRTSKSVPELNGEYVSKNEERGFKMSPPIKPRRKRPPSMDKSCHTSPHSSFGCEDHMKGCH